MIKQGAELKDTGDIFSLPVCTIIGTEVINDLTPHETHGLFATHVTGGRAHVVLRRPFLRPA